MNRLQHGTVAAQSNDDLSHIERAIPISSNQLLERLLGDRRRRRLKRDSVGRNGDQTRFRCSRTGMSRRTRAVTFASNRAVAHPVPSDTFATVWPQGSEIMEWP